VCDRLSLGVCWTGLLPRWPPHHWRWVAMARSHLTIWYIYREIQTFTYSSKGCAPDVQVSKKASTEVPTRVHVSGDANIYLFLGLILLFGTCIGRCEHFPIPLRDAHLTSRSQKSVNRNANPSIDEMCFNVSLSICIQVSTNIVSQVPSAPDPEQSGSLGRTPLRRVWAEEAA
jgi:hypothetical protein